MLRTSPWPMLWKESSMKFWSAVNMDATRSGSLSEGRVRERWTRGVPPESVRYTCSTVRRSGCGSSTTPPSVAVAPLIPSAVLICDDTAKPMTQPDGQLGGPSPVWVAGSFPPPRLRLQKRTKATTAIATGIAIVGAPPYGPVKLKTFVSTVTWADRFVWSPAASTARIWIVCSPLERRNGSEVARPTDRYGSSSRFTSYRTMPDVASAPVHEMITSACRKKLGWGLISTVGGVVSMEIWSVCTGSWLSTWSIIYL